MKDLIEALTILSKYTNAQYPTGCEHDEFRVYATGDVSAEDASRLSELSFDYDPDTESWLSFRFGSA